MRVFLAAVAAALVLPASVADARVGSLRVLFVGNSLTESNNLPGVVASLARSSGRRLEYGTVVFPGYSLEDHWNQGDARAALASGDWEIVVMQQGPSALPEGQAHLRLWAGRFADEARAHGIRPALLTVWPESFRGRAALLQVVASYRNAATAARATLLPGGAAWWEAWSCDYRIPLYGPDGFHPSRLGTYAAALVVYGRLFKAPLVTARTRRTRVVQKAAARALGRPVLRPCR
jgi:hypothetical protein